MMKNSVNECSIIILVLNWKETVIRGKSQKIYFFRNKGVTQKLPSKENPLE